MMNESTRDFFETLNKVLLRCWVLGLLLMLFSTGVFLLAGDVVDDIHGRLFGLSPHELDAIIYCGLGLMKLFVFVLFFFPWLAIKMALGKPV